MTKAVYNKYLREGFQLIELGEDKKPLKKRLSDGRCKKKSDPFIINKFYAVVPPNKLMIIDVDVKNGKNGLESLLKLEADLMLDLKPCVRTGSGGLHIYVTLDQSVRIIQKEYPDIDFIGYKANDRLCTPYAVAGGQTIQYENKDYVYELFEPSKPLIINQVDNISELLEIDKISVEADNSIMSVDDLYESKTPYEIEQLLSWLDSSDYQEWMANASAIKRELGNTKEAFEIFNEWSKTADNYDDRDACLKKWKEVGDYQGQPRTMATLYMNALSNKTNKLLSEINHQETTEDLIDLISDDKWLIYPKFTTSLISSEISKSFQARTQLLEYGLTYNEVQKLTKVLYGKDFIDYDEKLSVSDGPEDEAFSDYVMVGSFTRNPYFRLSDGSRYNLEMMGMLLDKPLISISKKLKLKKTMTVQQAFRNKLIDHATSHEYNPTTNEGVFINDRGQRVLNLFDPKTVPIATDLTSEGQKLIRKFRNHLANLMSKDEAEILLDWMAYATQNPGKKILWVPLIQSVEGVGKSLIGNLLINHVFGKDNAGVVDSVIIAEKNNSWASSKMLRILEEIKLSGHNRYEVLNQLKPLITNPTITRVEKFEVSSEVRNTCNFIAFTNFKDALPIDEHDRRWWLVFSPIDSLENLEKVVGQNRQDYFQPLHELSKPDSVYGTEFKTFLLNRDISSFNPNFPPDSKHKEELAEIERSKLTGIDEVQDLITFTYKDDQPKVINMTLLREASEQAMNDAGKRITPRSVSPRDMRSVLKKLGYKSIAKKDFANADWKGVSPMYYHQTTTTIPEAVKIWQKGYSVDFLADQFEDLDDEL